MAGQNKKLTIIDLFSGVGGLSLGFEQLGFDILFANDNDRWISETFKANHPNTEFYCGDVKDLSAADIKKRIKNKHVNVLVAGIPCQSFSMAGYRIRKDVDNVNDPRHFLFRKFIEIASGLKPDIVLIENVKGILSSHEGSIKKEIIDELEKIGYSVECRLLNAADYGVPQTRERVIFIGNRIHKKNIYPIKTHENKHEPVGKFLKNIVSLNHEPRVLTGITLQRVKLIKPGENWTSLPKKMQTKSRHSGAFGRIDPNKPSRTLTTRFDSPPVGFVTHPYEDRTLTVREGARIQGFPDDFEFLGPKINQYKQVGNAVPVGLSKALAKGIIEMLSKKK